MERNYGDYTAGVEAVKSAVKSGFKALKFAVYLNSDCLKSFSCRVPFF